MSASTPRRKATPVPSTGTDEVVDPDPSEGPPALAHVEDSTRVKVAIVGYTATRHEAPYGDPEWEVWGMNNLHTLPDVDTSKFTAWFDLHPIASIREDPAHLAWLQAGADGLPVYVWEPQPDWPTSVAFPREDMLSRFPPYFTNSVSWMVAFAMSGVMEAGETLVTSDGRSIPVPPPGAAIAVYGIDMAQGTEYAAQRPSCEGYIGMAMAAGFNVTLPTASDLFKTVAQYGTGEDDAFRTKLEQRNTELRAKFQEADQQMAHWRDVANQLRGALENNDYWRTTWVAPSATREPTPPTP